MLGCPQDNPISYMGGQPPSILHGVNVTTYVIERLNRFQSELKRPNLNLQISKRNFTTSFSQKFY